jgi:hypothetical protein
MLVEVQLGRRVNNEINSYSLESAEKNPQPTGKKKAKLELRDFSFKVSGRNS